jgi:large subunit ribosomal protein L7/L12
MSEENKVEESKDPSASSGQAETKTEEKSEDKSVAEEVKDVDPVKSSGEDNGVKVPAKFKDLVVEIEKMSVLDLSELVKVLEDKFGVSAVPTAVGVGIPGQPGADVGTPDEKSSFDVELTGAGDNKIGVIKAVREITQKGLKDAKDMVEGAPVVIKEGAKKDEAEEIKKKVEEAGGSVTLK